MTTNAKCDFTILFNVIGYNTFHLYRVFETKWHCLAILEQDKPKYFEDPLEVTILFNGTTEEKAAIANDFIKKLIWGDACSPIPLSVKHLKGDTFKVYR